MAKEKEKKNTVTNADTKKKDTTTTAPNAEKKLNGESKIHKTVEEAKKEIEGEISQLGLLKDIAQTVVNISKKVDALVEARKKEVQNSKAGRF